MLYTVYIAECSDSTLYTGITTDTERRIREHNSHEKGAKYTRSRQPVMLVYTEPGYTRSEALKREYIIKHLSKEEKLHLIQSQK